MISQQNQRMLETRTARYFIKKYHSTTLWSAIERAANEERSAYFSSTDGLGRIPVDIFSIARKKGIHVVEGGLTSNSTMGEVECTTRGFVVRLVKGVPKGRARFTLAHEIGHTLFYTLGKHQVGLLDKHELMAEESICNGFAGALLIPAVSLVKSIQPQQCETAHSLLWHVDELSHRFDVSVETFLIRLQSVHWSYAPALLLCFRYREHSESGRDPKLRVTQSVSLGQGSHFVAFRNKTAARIPLRSVQTLFSAWRNQLVAGFDASGGRYTWLQSQGILPFTRSREDAVLEDVRISVRESGHWPMKTLRVSTASCLYSFKGWGERDAYIVSALIPEAGRVRSSP
jgi:hypothetical protein